MSLRPRVLLVDDRPENLLALKAQLREQEADLLAAGSGDEALELLLSHEVALAIVDVQMPGMDGFELAELMRGSPRTKEIPIIFVTAGLHGWSKVFKGYEAGAVDFLIKPIEPRVLASKVAVFLQLERQKRALVERVRQMEAAERAREESERRFRTMADCISQLAWMARPDGYIYWYNRRWYEYTGTTPAQMEGWGWRSVHRPDVLADVVERWRAAIATGREFDMEFPLRGADGTFRRFLTRAFPLKGEDGRVVEWFGTNTDVTSLVEAQEALKASEARLSVSNAQLVEADRRKNEFMATLSHELRNPLAPIRNSLYVLDHAAPGSDQARRAKAVIDRQVNQLARLVDDLLDVTRITRNKVELQRERLELGQLVARTAEDHRTEFEKAGVALELEAATAPLWIHADWNRLAQAVGNLLQNAAKFTPRGGRVTASVSVEEGQQQAVIRVVDTGVGIDPELLARLFQPFMQADTTLDRSKGGLGLGLALVKGLVELHGGSVQARSAGVGHGTEFAVRLPLESASVAAERRPATGAVARRQRVLIIEDNADAADSLREALECEEHEVAVTYDGPMGIERAREFSPTVIFCDIGLPGMDGYEVARALRSEPSLQGVQLVALTGYALPEDLQRAREAGFHQHMAKPPSLERIRELFAFVSGSPAANRAELEGAASSGPRPRVA